MIKISTLWLVTKQRMGVEGLRSSTIVLAVAQAMESQRTSGILKHHFQGDHPWGLHTCDRYHAQRYCEELTERISRNMTTGTRWPRMLNYALLVGVMARMTTHQTATQTSLHHLVSISPTPVVPNFCLIAQATSSMVMSNLNIRLLAPSLPSPSSPNFPTDVLLPPIPPTGTIASHAAKSSHAPRAVSLLHRRSPAPVNAPPLTSVEYADRCDFDRARSSL